jgi:formylglycine-generating enzyme required for sulfatase activity
MGSPDTEAGSGPDERPQTVVTLTRGYFIGTYELTQGEYAGVLGKNPSYFRNGVAGSSQEGTGDAVTNELRHPVEQVTWSDATNYCAQLTQRERSAGRLPIHWAYRLPTEAEWEYACRGGTTTAFHYGPALRSGMANFNGHLEYDSSFGTKNNSSGIYLGRTAAVGSYAPNRWGSFDMHGNVWEWCSDWYNCPDLECVGLPGGYVTDPKGPATGLYHVVRGGGAGDCRSAGRNDDIDGPAPAWFIALGFRVVLALDP